MDWSRRWSQLQESRRFSEVVGLLMLVLAAILLGSLLSFDAADPSWFHRPSSGETSMQPVHNWAGKVGATLAEGLLQLLGAGAFLAPALLAVLGWNRFRGRGAVASYARSAGHGVLLLGLVSLLELMFHWIAYGGAVFPAGGVVGQTLAAGLRSVLNPAGALLVSAALVLAAVVATTRFSLAAFLEWAWQHVRRLAVRLSETSRRARPRMRGWARAVATFLAAPFSRRRARAREVPAPAEVKTSPEPRRPIPLAFEPEPPAPGPQRAEPRPRARRPTRPPAAPKQQSLPIERDASGYALPPLELLNEPEEQPREDEKALMERARLLTEKFREFSVNGSVVAIHPGPVVTTFEFKPEAGVKYSKITGLTDDLCLALRAESVRIDRIPGRATVGIEVPNRRQEIIFPRELLASEAFRKAESKLTLALGKTINGEVFTADLARMPHLLIAGATGAGKSVGLNGMIASILYKATPADVRFIMIDTKMIELGIYGDIPHLLIPVVTEAKKASTALKWAVREMEIRYRQLASVGVRNIEQFNALLSKEPDRTMTDERTGEEKPLKRLPYIVIVIDEMADLMIVSSAEVEESVMRLAQMARAVGIHLILATQRPSVDVITGTIKANFPSRVAFRVSSRVDSRTIIDQVGAEQLLGRGDMLFLPPGSARLLRLHGGFITEAELNRITTFLKRQAEPQYDESVLKEPEEARPGFGDGGERDPMFMEAVKLVLQEGQCSTTFIQRRLRLGYARAARIVDSMEQEGIVGPADGSKPREVLVGPEILDVLQAPS